MIDKVELTKCVEAYIADKDLFLVEITVSKDNEIVVTVDSDESLDIDMCVALTRHIEANFDRDAEDYELEVGSAGLSSPFKIKRQYVKNIGNEVETYTTKGEKIVGELAEVGDDSFTVKVIKKVKPEGAKRKIEVEENIVIPFAEAKQTKCSIKI